MHFLEDPEALLMPVVDLCEQWEIVSRVLIQEVVLNDHELQLLHVEPRIHLDRALVHQVNDRTLHLNRLLVTLQLCSTGLVSYDGMNNLFNILLLFVLVEDGLEDLLGLLLALIEIIVVCADHHDAEVNCEVANVNVKDELL